MFSDETLDKLKAPLAREFVKTRQQGNISLSYIESWHAIDEANRIFGFDKWHRHTDRLDLVSEEKNSKGNHIITYIAQVTVRVQEGTEWVARQGTGAGHGIGKDLGQAHESAVKEAESDAMKRALMTFGNPFGLALYDKDQRNVTDDQAKGNIVKAKDAFREFKEELDMCSDEEELDMFLEAKKNLIERMRVVIPEWCERTSQQPSLDDRIHQKRQQIKEQSFQGAVNQ